jgi:hypothetical protein
MSGMIEHFFPKRQLKTRKSDKQNASIVKIANREMSERISFVWENFADLQILAK